MAWLVVLVEWIDYCHHKKGLFGCRVYASRDNRLTLRIYDFDSCSATGSTQEGRSDDALFSVRDVCLDLE
jgi:hypothetical protein